MAQWVGIVSTETRYSKIVNTVGKVGSTVAVSAIYYIYNELTVTMTTMSTETVVLITVSLSNQVESR